MAHVCRFCGSSNNTKLNCYTINDEIVIKWLQFIPEIVISEDETLSTSVCQLCYGKTKISHDLIQQVMASQQKFKQAERSREQILTKLCTVKLVRAQVQQDMPIKLDWKDENIKHEIVEDPELVTVKSSDDEEVFAMEESSDSNSNFSLPAFKRLSETNSRNSKEVYINAPITFTCSMCKNAFPTFLKLSVHMKQKNCVVIKHICKVCNKEFPTKRRLSKHGTTHKPKHRLMCEVCGKSFSSQFDLSFHSEVAHAKVANDGVTYRCSHCPDSFNSHSTLQAHLGQHNKHKNESSRLCEICAKSCPNLKSYQAHLATHKDKRFICDICNKAFQRAILLVQHMHVHTGIKAFKCDHCDRAFAKRDSLRSHKKKEHDEH